MIRLICVVLTVLVWVGCGSSSNGGKNPGGDFLGSYELEDGCSTGRQVFKGSSEDELGKAFCDGLKDNKRNKDCALFQRQQTFGTAKCPGTWPYANPGGINSNSSKMYSYQENGCSTGIHFFGSSNEKSALRIYCVALKDEDLNRGCAKASRDEAYAKNNCQATL